MPTNALVYIEWSKKTSYFSFFLNLNALDVLSQPTPEMCERDLRRSQDWYGMSQKMYIKMQP